MRDRETENDRQLKENQRKIQQLYEKLQKLEVRC